MHSVPITSSLLFKSHRSRGRGRGRGRKRFGTGRRPGRPPKFIRLDPPVDTGGEKTTVSGALIHAVLINGVGQDLTLIRDNLDKVILCKVTD